MFNKKQNTVVKTKMQLIDCDRITNEPKWYNVDMSIAAYGYFYTDGAVDKMLKIARADAEKKNVKLQCKVDDLKRELSVYEPKKTYVVESLGGEYEVECHYRNGDMFVNNDGEIVAQFSYITSMILVQD
jgi:hypothetical protein